VKLAEQLFAEHGEFIRSVIRYVASSNDYTEDLFHSLFLFFIARPVPNDVRNVRGFLYKVTLDKVRDWLRSRTLYQKKLRHYSAMKLQEQPGLQKEPDTSENTQKMMGLIEKHLSKAEAKAILLRYGNHYPIEKVAEEMNVKPRSVSRYISTGLKKVRGLLDTAERSNYDEGA
jgi:RNA polymerase sigma factor (sigma-70 family)